MQGVSIASIGLYSQSLFIENLMLHLWKDSGFQGNVQELDVSLKEKYVWGVFFSILPVMNECHCDVSTE